MQKQHKPCDAAINYCQYCMLIILRPTKGSGTEDKSFAKNYITGQSQRTLIILCKYVSAQVHAQADHNGGQ